MKSISCTVLLALLAMVHISLAQDSITKPAPSVDKPAAAVQNAKPYLVSPDNMLMRCTIPAFLKCMKWGASECVDVISRAVAEGNQKVEAEAAAKTEAETGSDFFKGYATGVVIGKIHTASKGKLLGCLGAQKA